MLLAITALAVFALGYTTRCYRPLHRIDTWAWNQIDRRASDLRAGPARRRPGWYAAEAVFAVELTAAFVLAPRDTVAAVRETRALRRKQREATQ